MTGSTGPTGNALTCDANDNLVANGLMAVYAGSDNTVLGCGAFQSATGGSAVANTVVGNSALDAATQPIGNVVMGSNACTTHTTATFTNNVCIGLNCGNALPGSCTGNVAVGANALGANMVTHARNQSVALGVGALNSPIDGITQTRDVAIGYNCNQSPGFDGNVTIGAEADCLGHNSVGIGAFSYIDPVCDDCTLIGTNANIGGGLRNTVVGSLGIIIGPVGSNNVVVGGRTTVAVPANIQNINYGLALGVNARVTANSGIALGAGTTAITPFGLFTYTGLASVGVGTAMLHNPANGQIGPNVSSARYKHNVRDLEVDSGAVWSLAPKTFQYNADDATDFGYIAEEVEAVLPALVVHNGQGQPESVRYDKLGVLLLEELRKLEARVAALENA